MNKKSILSLKVPVEYYIENKKYHILLSLRGYAYIGTSEVSYEKAEEDLQNILKKLYPDYYKGGNI